MLAKSARITDEKTFSLIIKKGYPLSFSLIRVKWVFSKNHYPRFGVIVSNKISKKAVIRNTIKRRIREIIREWIQKHPTVQIDGIIIVKPTIVNASFQDIKKEVLYATDKIVKKIQEKQINTYKYKEK